MPPVEHYTDAATVANLNNKPEAAVKTEWLDWADDAIEEYLGGGFKGATRTVRLQGNQDALLSLPSQADTVSSINVRDTVLSTDTYELWEDGKTLERISGGDYWPLFSRGPEWEEGVTYKVVYVEPIEVPKRVQASAAQLVNECVIWAAKYDRHGAANSSTFQGSAGAGSASATISFADGLPERFQAILKHTLGRSGGFV